MGLSVWRCWEAARSRSGSGRPSSTVRILTTPAKMGCYPAVGLQVVQVMQSASLRQIVCSRIRTLDLIL